MSLFNSSRAITAFLLVLLAMGSGVGGYATRDQWLPLLQSPEIPVAKSKPAPAMESPKVLKISPQARRNLGLYSKPVELSKYMRSIQVPGVIVDRPGISDRGITAPAVGVVTKIHAFSGDTVEPEQELFTLRLFSEYLQNTQSELFKATREIELINEERIRIEGLVKKGTLSGNRMVELSQRTRRQEGLIQAYRQDLLTRGLAPTQIEKIADGKFVSTIQVVAPPPFGEVSLAEGQPQGPVYEMQELRVDLGQQVQAGQLLCVLSNHQSLYIEGHAFKRESSMLERAAQNGWPIDVEFAEDVSQEWPNLAQTFRIRHLANTIDEVSRTFGFFIPLTNQSRSYVKNGESFVVWRFRPGQRVRLQVPVEEFTDVIVLPTAALVREGPEAFVFRQNGDLFNRIPVHILHEDSVNVVVANDGSVDPGVYLAHGSAASLNRVLKAQAASGKPINLHVHADGTVHESH